MSMTSLLDVKVFLTDVEGFISDYTLKARTVLFDKSLQYLVENLGYPEAVKGVRYEAAYLNGNFFIHNQYCYVVDISFSQKSSNYFFGLLNYTKRILDYLSILEAKQPLNVNNDLEQLRSSLEASVISAVFEKTYRSTPEKARDIFEKCKDKEYGNEIRKKLVTDCRRALNYAMYECPEIRSAIMAKPSEYLVRKEMGIAGLNTYRHFGKYFVLKSEYDFYYTNAMMSYVLNDSSWLNRFSAVLVGCTERWMDISCTDMFLPVNTRTGEVMNAEITRLCSGRVYTGGSAELLRRLMGATSSEIFYHTADAVAMTKAIRNLKWGHSLEAVSQTDCPGWEARVESTRPTWMSPTRSDALLAQLLKMAKDEEDEQEDDLGDRPAPSKAEIVESFKALKNVMDEILKAEDDAGSEDSEEEEEEEEEDDEGEDGAELADEEESKIEVESTRRSVMSEDPATEFDLLSQNIKEMSPEESEEDDDEVKWDTQMEEELVDDNRKRTALVAEMSEEGAESKVEVEKSGDSIEGKNPEGALVEKSAEGGVDLDVADVAVGDLLKEATTEQFTHFLLFNSIPLVILGVFLTLSALFGSLLFETSQ